MGFFDLAFPWLDRADAWMGALPPLARISVWAAVAAAVSMALYWLLSPQARIAELKRRLRRAQADLDAHDGELREALPLMRRTLSLSFRQLVVVLVPAVVASLPLLFLLSWMFVAYGHSFPRPGQAVAVVAEPDGYHARWDAAPADGNGASPRVVVTDASGDTIADVAVRAPASSIYKRQWWNALFGNPAGYLPAQVPVRQVNLRMPERTYVPFGPRWFRGWEPVFFGVLVLLSVLIKVVFRIR